MKRWTSYLFKAYRHGPVLTLGSIGLLAILGGLFTEEGWGQSVLIEIGAALLLIPPIVVTERLVLSEDVRQMTQQALQQVSRLQEDLSTQKTELMRLFSADTDYLSSEALELFRESSRRRHISKWGIAVPLVSGRYDLLLAIHFSDSNEGSSVHVLPVYAIDAQSSLNARAIADEEPPAVISEMVWDIKSAETTASLLRRVRDDLLDRGIHPKHELDFGYICETIKRNLIIREEARTPGNPYRSNVGSIVCLIGDEIAVTTKGIEHLKEHNSEPVPMWAVFKKAGLRERKSKEESPISDEYYLEKSGFHEHLDMTNALTAIRVLYRSRVLRGLYDHRLQ